MFFLQKILNTALQQCYAILLVHIVCVTLPLTSLTDPQNVFFHALVYYKQPPIVFNWADYWTTDK